MLRGQHDLQETFHVLCIEGALQLSTKMFLRIRTCRAQILRLDLGTMKMADVSRIHTQRMKEL